LFIHINICSRQQSSITWHFFFWGEEGGWGVRLNFPVTLFWIWYKKCTHRNTAVWKHDIVYSPLLVYVTCIKSDMKSFKDQLCVNCVSLRTYTVYRSQQQQNQQMCNSKYLKFHKNDNGTWMIGTTCSCKYSFKNIWY
jgi:hypothetical protein